MRKIRVALYGGNGHQLTSDFFAKCPYAEAVAACFPNRSDEWIGREYPSAKIYKTLDEMLSDEQVELVSLCSPMRCSQDVDALACIRAKKHVYAEKPLCFSEDLLDLLLGEARANGVEIHERTDAVFCEPFWTARRLISEGKIGEVIQVHAQKTYPPQRGSRPQDENVDGGLIRWVGIHAISIIEHVTGRRVSDIDAFETQLGNPERAGLRMAAAFSMRLDNGAVATATANYLKPDGFPLWGKEAVTVFGEKGILEINDGGIYSHIYTEKDEGAIEAAGCKDYPDALFEHLATGVPFPLTVEEEFHPLRIVIRAKNKVDKEKNHENSGTA